MKKEAVDNILEIGKNLVSKKGYNNVGIQEILDTANIPKGSFYYYFKSKEDFGRQLIEYYSKNSSSVLESYLGDKTKDPKERIVSFFMDMKDMYVDKDFKEGCLLGNCSLELSDISDILRYTVASGIEEWEQYFVACIKEGQELGVIKKQKSAVEMADFIVSGWHGALLKMKASRSETSMRVFVDFITEYIL